MWADTEQVFVVNGFVNKGDGNFELDFQVGKIEDCSVTIGSFPQTDQDINVIK